MHPITSYSVFQVQVGILAKTCLAIAEQKSWCQPVENCKSL